MSELNIHTVLHNIQKQLKAPKGNYNSFGKYYYRSCEDIVEAVKEIMPEGHYLTLSDEIVMLGNRFYIKATAMLHSKMEEVAAYGYARESEDKKGMDSSQITGAASSYARKYALNGLFAIDDTKDADTDEFKKNLGVVKGGVLDDETRDEAKLEFLRQVYERLDKVSSAAELEEALTTEQKNFWKNKLAKIDQEAFRALNKRFKELQEVFKNEL